MWNGSYYPAPSTNRPGTKTSLPGITVHMGDGSACRSLCPSRRFPSTASINTSYDVNHFTTAEHENQITTEQSDKQIKQKYRYPQTY